MKFFGKFFGRQRQHHEDEHQLITEELQEHERKLETHSRLLRRLELEAGIFKPPLKGANSGRHS